MHTTRLSRLSLRTCVLALPFALLVACESAPSKTTVSTASISNSQFERVQSLVGDWYLVDADEDDRIEFEFV